MASVDIAANGKRRESVWDYPRPPAIERVSWHIRIVHHGVVIVDAPEAVRVMETSQPPAYYIHPDHIDLEQLRPSPSATFCEWKGVAGYLDVVVGDRVAVDAGWRYDDPTPAYAELTDHHAFYAQKLDECYVDDERVESNEGSFYGGWITANVVGPFKGGPGTMHW